LTDSQFDFVNYHLKFRGPDHTNRLQHTGLHFVHNLLHTTGVMTPQPLQSSDGNIVVVYNGEIYNAADFGNYQSDGPSIIDAYLKHGVLFARHLDGEFAIVLVDFTKKRAVLATDTFGTKPFFYSVGDGKFSAATYSSPLERLNRPNIQQMEPNTALVFDTRTWEVQEEMPLHKFDLRQYKGNTQDWAKAFEQAILKRSKSAHSLFIGLSSGYDSGVLACALVRLGVPHHAYSIMGNEHESTIDKRLQQASHLLMRSEKVNLTVAEFRSSKEALMRDADKYEYTVTNVRDADKRKKDIRNEGDAAALYHISGIAKRDKVRIYLSGSGSDAIISDYGWNGTRLTAHSSFGGLFPTDLSEVFPWTSFFKGAQQSSLMKEEYVSGSHGLEGRYPFLDKALVQEFLWLTAEVKNRMYKAPVTEYLWNHDCPLDANLKVEFAPLRNREWDSANAKREQGRKLAAQQQQAQGGGGGVVSGGGEDSCGGRLEDMLGAELAGKVDQVYEAKTREYDAKERQHPGRSREGEGAEDVSLDDFLKFNEGIKAEGNGLQGQQGRPQERQQGSLQVGTAPVKRKRSGFIGSADSAARRAVSQKRMKEEPQQERKEEPREELKQEPREELKAVEVDTQHQGLHHSGKGNRELFMGNNSLQASKPPLVVQWLGASWNNLTVMDETRSMSPQQDVLFWKWLEWDSQRRPFPVEENSFAEVHAYGTLSSLRLPIDTTELFAEFNELYRILQPGGMLCGSSPAVHRVDGTWSMPPWFGHWSSGALTVLFRELSGGGSGSSTSAAKFEPVKSALDGSTFTFCLRAVKEPRNTAGDDGAEKLERLRVLNEYLAAVRKAPSDCGTYVHWHAQLTGNNGVTLVEHVSEAMAIASMAQPTCSIIMLSRGRVLTEYDAVAEAHQVSDAHVHSERWGCRMDVPHACRMRVARKRIEWVLGAILTQLIHSLVRRYTRKCFRGSANPTTSRMRFSTSAPCGSNSATVACQKLYVTSDWRQR
jgi:asparagine synthetase B (glutamine-hydrolysing)